MKIILLLLPLIMISSLTHAAPRIGGHGDMIMKCHKPIFFDESPAKDSEVKIFQEFKFKASENTDIATLKVWVNNESIKVSIQKLLSGRYLVSGKSGQSLNKGKAWLKVTSESNDGCNALQSWYVNIK